MGGARLGHAGIEYRTVRAADDHQQPRLIGAPEPAALRVRVLHRDDGLVPLTQQQKWAQLDPARRVIAADLAGDVVALLSSDAEVVVHRSEESDLRLEAVRPGHIAVLVSRNRDAATVRDALDAAGVPAVINGAGSVFLAPVARDWRALLEALERPSSSTRVHGARLVRVRRLVGRAGRHRRRRRLGGHLRPGAPLGRVAAPPRRRRTARVDHPQRGPARHGCSPVATASARSPICATSASCSTPRRWPGGSASPPWRRGCAAGSSEARQDVANEDRSRRLESDSEAVQVLTDPPQQGPRVPDRLLPVPVERGVDRQQRSARVPRPEERRPADDRRRWRGRSRLLEQLGSDMSRRSAARSCASPTLR